MDLSRVTLRVGQIARLTRPVLEFAKLDNTPYTVTWSNFDAAPPLLQALGVSAIDIGQAGATGLVLAQASGVKFRLIASQRTLPAYFRIVVAANSPIQAVADLRGKKVGVFKGSAGHGYLIHALNEAGLSEDNIKRVDLTPAQASAALRGGNIEAWATWEPYIAQTRLAFGTRVLADSNDYSSLSFFAVSPKALEDPAKEAAIRDFLDRYRRSNTYVNAHLDGWVEQYARITNLPPDVAAAAAPNTVQTIAPITDDVRALYAKTADDFTKAKLITAEPDGLDLVFDDRFNGALR